MCCINLHIPVIRKFQISERLPDPSGSDNWDSTVSVHKWASEVIKDVSLLKGCQWHPTFTSELCCTYIGTETSKLFGQLLALRVYLSFFARFSLCPTIASCLHLGGPTPPHWFCQGFVILGKVSGGNIGWGGGADGDPRAPPSVWAPAWSHKRGGGFGQWHISKDL